MYQIVRLEQWPTSLMSSLVEQGQDETLGQEVPWGNKPLFTYDCSSCRQHRVEKRLTSLITGPLVATKC